MKPKDPLPKFLFPSIIVLGLTLALGGGWWLRSYYEARAFERVTGQQVSVWDAMFLHLRVDGCGANRAGPPTPLQSGLLHDRRATEGTQPQAPGD